MELAKVAEAKAAEAASLFIPTPPLNGHRYARRHQGEAHCLRCENA